jgi:hypothetical protein
VAPESKYTKFAVHCAPLVSVWTPGWIVAVAAGAHVGAAAAVNEVAAAVATSDPHTMVMTAIARTRTGAFSTEPSPESK